MTQIPVQINLGEDFLKQAVANQMIDGELGEMIARQLAEWQAEIMTFNYTEAAQLLNKSRPTVHALEREGKLKFAKDKTISLKALLEYRRSEAAEPPESETENIEIERRPATKKRRTFR